MNGTLKFTGAGWEVEYVARESKSGRWIVDRLSIYQETFNQTIKQPIIPLVEGMQVEFEIEDFWETGLEQVYKIAKLIRPKINIEETPKEEPKDVVLGYKTSLDAQMLDSKLPKQENCCTPEGQIKRYVDCIGCDRKPKQETLEEAMAANGYDFPASDNLWREGVQFGANWQAERMYSEEEVIEFTMNMISQYVVGNTNIWDRDRLKETLLLKKL